MSGLIPSRQTCANGSSDSNYFVRVGNNGNSEIVGDLTVGGDVDVGGNVNVGIDINVTQDVNIGDTLFVDTIQSKTTAQPVLINDTLRTTGNILALTDISCAGDVFVTDISCTGVGAFGSTTAVTSVQANRMFLNGTTVPSALQGTVYRVNGVDSGRVNHDATNMNITGLTAPAYSVRILCDASAALICSKGSGATAGHMNAEFGTVDCSKTVLTVRDKTSQYYVANSYSVRIAQGGGTAFPLNGTTNEFTPNFSGRYTFEMTYLFSVSGDISNSNIVLGFRVSGGDDDYGACLAAGKVVTLPTTDIPAFPYTISSGGHQLTAGTTYTVTYIYQGAAGAKGGTPPIGANAGGYVMEAYYG